MYLCEGVTFGAFCPGDGAIVGRLPATGRAPGAGPFAGVWRDPPARGSGPVGGSVGGASVVTIQC